MPEILGIIPARAGSKRIPGKNLRRLSGKPLVCYAMEAAQESQCLSDIVLSSDSFEILDQAKIYNQRIIPIERPAQLALDESMAIDYVIHALEFMKSRFQKIYDWVVIIQPTSPFTRGFDIDKTFEQVILFKAESSVSITELAHDLHPSKYKVIQNNKLVPFFNEREDKMAAHLLEKIYIRNGSVYVSSTELIHRGKILSDNCAAYLMPAERSVDINSEKDFLFAEFLIQLGKR